MPSSPPAAGGATPPARVSPPDPLAGGHRPKARAGAHIRSGPDRSDPECSRDQPSAVRWAGPRRTAGGPIRRSDAAACSATAATTTTRSKCAASLRGGRETPPSASTCPGLARRQSAQAGLRRYARAASAGREDQAPPRARREASAPAPRRAVRHRSRAPRDRASWAPTSP